MTSRPRRRVWKTLKNDAIYHAARGLMRAAAAIPLPIGLKLGSAIGSAAFTVLRPDRAKVLRHLKIAFPESSPEWRERTGRDSFRQLGMSFFELFHLDEIFAGRGPMPDYCRMTGSENFDRVLEKGVGAVMVTAHVGNWEMTAAYAAHRGYPIRAIVRSLYDERIDKMLNDHRRKYGYGPLARGGQDIEEVLAVIRNKEFLGLLVDQDTKVRGVWLPFLGVDAHTPTGPAFLAYTLELDVIPCFNHREPDGRIVVEIGAPVPRPQTGDRAADVKEYTRLLNDCISDHIRRYPAQWVWMHRRWKKRPPGEPPHLNPDPAPPQGGVCRKAWVGAIERIAARLSWNAADTAGAWLGRASILVSPRRRRLSAYNRHAALAHRMTDTEVTRVGRRAAEYRGKMALDYLRADKMDVAFFSERVEWDGLDGVRASLAGGRGVILIGGHIGSLDVGLWGLARSGVPVALVDRVISDRFFRQWIARLRARHGVLTWTPETAVDVMADWLSRSGCVAFSIDRNVSRERGVIVRFFERFVNTDRLPAELAERTGATVHLYASLRLGPGRHRVLFSPAFEPPAGGDAVRDATQAFTVHWQDVIETYPEQWTWGHDRFVLRPESAASS